jgi:ATP-binding cassette subfamily C protein LapB
MTERQHLKPAGFRTENLHLVLGTAALCVLSLALPVMTLQVYDRILPNPDSGTLPVLMAFVSVAVLLEIALRLARAWMIGWKGAVYEQAMATAAMQHVLSSDVARAARYGVGGFLGRLGAVGKLKDFYNGYALVTLVELAFVPVFLGVIFYIARPLAFIPLMLLAVFTVLTAAQGRVLREALQKRDTADDRRYNFLIECLKSVHTLKAFAIEKLIARRYESLQEQSGLASFYTAEASTATFNAGTTLSHVMMAVVMTTGAVMAIHGEITMGALIATLQLSGRLMQPVQRGLVLWAKYQDFRVARRKVEGLFALPRTAAEARAPLPPLAEDVAAPMAEGYLSLRNLSYGTVLKNVTLDLEPGDVVAIGGAARAGKTELLEILAGLYPPDEGAVLIDGVDMRHYAPEALAHHVGYMATEGVVFRGTIRDNITRFGMIPEARAREVTGFLAVDQDVARLPSGFDTVLQADGADRVPPGLRQRIAMTRVLAARPHIILFDEADRSLDRAGYNLVFAMLARLSRKTAMIIVSDDANITALAARHYVLEDGALVQQSQPAERKRAS